MTGNLIFELLILTRRFERLNLQTVYLEFVSKIFTKYCRQEPCNVQNLNLSNFIDYAVCEM